MKENENVYDWCPWRSPWVHEAEDLLKGNKCAKLLAWSLVRFQGRRCSPCVLCAAAYRTQLHIHQMHATFTASHGKALSSSDDPRFESNKNTGPGKHILAKRHEHKSKTIERNEQICQTAASTTMLRIMASTVSVGSIGDFLETCLEHPVLWKKFLQSMKEATVVL